MKHDWVKIKNRTHPEYRKGVQEFLDFAFAQSSVEDQIFCPCKNCNNYVLKTRGDVEGDLLTIGIVSTYTRWFRHGEERHDPVSEESDSDDETDVGGMSEMLEDHFRTVNTTSWLAREQSGNGLEELNEDSAKFYRLLGKNDQRIFPNCKYTKLSLIVKLFHIKYLGGLTNKSFTMLLELLNDMLSKGDVELPKSFYEARKIIRDLGLDYIKIHACVNDCMLYWKENSNVNNCLICGVSRWKSNEGSSMVKKVPHKILHYFPLTPRL